jgi:hypothetical protein
MSARLPKFSLGQGPDRIFNLLAIGLVAILIIGLCGIGFVFLTRPKGAAPAKLTPAPTETPLLAKLTPVATWTFTPTPPLTPTPTFTPVLAGAPTPTPAPLTPTPTPTPTPGTTTTPPTGYGLPLLAVGIGLFIVILALRKLRL